MLLTFCLIKQKTLILLKRFHSILLKNEKFLPGNLKVIERFLKNLVMEKSKQVPSDFEVLTENDISHEALTEKEVFKNDLINMGYKLREENVCSHEKRHYAMFVQIPLEYLEGWDKSNNKNRYCWDDLEFMRNHNKNIYLEWEERSCCAVCLPSLIMSLDSSGLYFNVRIFQEGEDMTAASWGDVKEVDPEEEIWDDEEEW